jgi:hypothetical protein
MALAIPATKENVAQRVELSFDADSRSLHFGDVPLHSFVDDLLLTRVHEFVRLSDRFKREFPRSAFPAIAHDVRPTDDEQANLYEYSDSPSTHGRFFPVHVLRASHVNQDYAASGSRVWM